MNKRCMNKDCLKLIPEIRIDSIGRKLTKSTKYCCKKCRNDDIKARNKDKYKSYYQNYYQNNKEKYKPKAKASVV